MITGWLDRLWKNSEGHRGKRIFATAVLGAFALPMTYLHSAHDFNVLALLATVPIGFLGGAIVGWYLFLYSTLDHFERICKERQRFRIIAVLLKLLWGSSLVAIAIAIMILAAWNL